ncbi:DEAD/DEAH box helicase [Actinomadura litoris]|uniref:DEAD/DEAH box helicase n=1 Tax=Actinomadura litoris TaxID=2678616 RepID=A0A7K1LB66_9ACTN|nr:DEAD/DEAH box helicase [Actinomadura litoris]MUN41671.1 DEAD/DEAH box helicase [Actinomadura litoris]
MRAVGLLPHQREAVGKAVRALAGGGRAQLLSPCGTGKTITASAVDEELAAAGRTLVTVPTLELAAQTLREWRSKGGRSLGTVVVACSDPAVLTGREVELDTAAVVTTSPEQIAAAGAVPGRVTMVSTYDSAPMVAAAHTNHDLPAWDLLVVDEAHRTVGAPGRPWSVVHHDAQIPALRRLYMTATPRISGTSDSDTVAMDDHQVFGPVCSRMSFGTAISRGLLADYRLVVAVVTNQQVLAAVDPASAIFWQVGRAGVRPDTLAVQVAVLRAMGEFDIRRAISFHPRIQDARMWSIVLPQATGLVPEGPQQVWTAHLEAEHTGAERRRVLARLGRAGDEVCLVANARVLTEGVDVPAVDGVVFTSANASPVDTVQAIGRALRTGGVTGKVASIIVPLLVGDGEDPHQAALRSDWAPVWRVVRALRDHDERLETALTDLRRGQGARVPAPDGEPARELPRWFQVRGIPVPPDFADAITVRAVEATTPKWEVYYGALKAFRDRHGHLDLPRHHQVRAGALDLDVGDFVSWMRTYKRRGELSREREKLLDAIGMVWNAQDLRWERKYALAAAFYREHGHLLIPDSHVAADQDGKEHKLGKWISVQRQYWADGRIRPARKNKLDTIGMIWEVQEHLWEQGYDEAKAFVRRNGNLQVGIDYQSPRSGYPLGKWLYTQSRQLTDGVLPQKRRRRLDALDPGWARRPPRRRPAGKTSR